MKQCQIACKNGYDVLKKSKKEPEKMLSLGNKESYEKFLIRLLIS